jgi:hypothetical protein
MTFYMAFSIFRGGFFMQYKIISFFQYFYVYFYDINCSLCMYVLKDKINIYIYFFISIIITIFHNFMKYYLSFIYNLSIVYNILGITYLLYSII